MHIYLSSDVSWVDDDCADAALNLMFCSSVAYDEYSVVELCALKC